VVWGCYHVGICVPWLAVIGYIGFNVCSVVTGIIRTQTTKHPPQRI